MVPVAIVMTMSVMGMVVGQGQPSDEWGECYIVTFGTTATPHLEGKGLEEKDPDTRDKTGLEGLREGLRDPEGAYLWDRVPEGPQARCRIRVNPAIRPAIAMTTEPIT